MFVPLLQFNCSQYLQLFICSVFIPVCIDEVPGTIPACKNLCETVRNDCQPHLETIRHQWPAELNCERFPSPPDLCVQRPALEKIEFPHLNHSILNDVPVSTAYSHCPPRFASVDETCSPLCNVDAFYRKDDKNFTQMWTVTWACVSLLATALTLLTYCMDRSRFRYPERPILFLSCCCLLYSCIILLKILIGSSVFICDGEHLVVKSSDNMLCALSSFILQYLAMAIRMWWLVFCICWYLHATCEWSNESLTELSSWFHGIVYSLSIIPPLLALLTGHIVADELTESCTIREEAILWFIFIPQFLCLLTGGLLSIRTAFSLCYIRTSLLASGRGAQKLERLMIRLCLFTVMFVLVEFCYLVCTAYESWHRPWWKSLALLSALDCPTMGTCNPEPMYHTASIEVVLLRILFSLLVGVSSVMWVCSGKTYRTWRQVLHAPKKLMPVTKV